MERTRSIASVTVSWSLRVITCSACTHETTWASVTRVHLPKSSTFLVGRCFQAKHAFFSDLATIPEDPFYTKWWFLVIVALLILIVIVIFIATLCITSSSSKYKSEKNHAFDTLQLSDGGIVSYELQSKRMKRYCLASFMQLSRVSRNEPHRRPETHNTWISEEQLRDPVTVYGSIASGISGTAPVNSMYRALNTDTVPGTYDASYRNSMQPNYQPEQPLRAEYASRNQLASGDSPTSEYHISNFNAGNRFSDAVDYGLQEPQSVYGTTLWLRARVHDEI